MSLLRRFRACPSRRRAGVAAVAVVLVGGGLTACGSSALESSGGGGGSAGGAVDASCKDSATLRTSLVPLYPLIRVGTDAGIFGKNCLRVVDTPATAPLTALAAIVGGSVDLTLLPFASIVTSVEQKIDVKVVAPGAQIPVDAASLPPAKVDAAGVFLKKGSGVTRPRELEGKTVAVAGLGSSMQQGTMVAINEDGGDASKVKFVAFDSQTEVQQLQAGKIDAAVIAVPFSTKVEAAGFKRIASPSLAYYGPGLAYTPWVTTGADYAAKTEAFKRFRTAIVEVQTYAAEHPEKYQQAQAQSTKVPLTAIQAGPGFWFAKTVTTAELVRFADKMKKNGFLDQVPDLDKVVVAGG